MTAPTALAPPPGSGLHPVPGDAGRPVIGYTMDFLRDQVGWARRRYERFGPVSWCRAFGTTMVNVFDAHAVETVTANRDRAFSQSAWDYFIGRFFTGGLMLLDGEEHHRHRRIMLQAFSRQRLASYAASMGPVIERGVAGWQPAERFLVYPALKQLTLDVATRTFMGAEPGPEADRVNQAFVDAVRAGTALVRAPVPGSRWRRGLVGRRVLVDYFSGLVPQKRAGDGDDLFSALCHARSEEGEVLDDDDVVNQMVFLMMAAHDTVTITLATMAYELARHPEWRERARAESVALADEPLDLTSVERLRTLDLVMRESLRLVTPVPTLPRTATRDTELLGFHVPAGVMLVLQPNLVHRLPTYWPDPDRFDPTRFEADAGDGEDRTDRGQARHRGVYVPFGGGVHRCIGMHFGQIEAKAVMHHLLRRFDWSVPEGYRMPVDSTALPKPADDLPVRLERIG